MKHFIDLFICNLFNDSVSNSDDIALNDVMALNNDTERVWKRATVA